MTEQVPPTDSEGTEPEAETSHLEDEAPGTGVPAVDAALTELDRLDDAPLEEHQAAFERVHESLRSALDARSGDQPGDPD